MDIQEFKTFFKSATNKWLGGTTAQFKMAPSYRKAYDLSKVNAKNPIESGVLILFYPNKNKEIHFVLTKRATYKGHHSNQISFPGGKKNESDSNLLETALRETYEEIGIIVPKEDIVLQLTDVYIPPSNFIVKVFLAVIDYTPQFICNNEVESLITPSLSELLDSKNRRESLVQTSSNKHVLSPSFVFDNTVTWGATAMMLSELKELLLSKLPFKKQNSLY